MTKRERDDIPREWRKAARKRRELNRAGEPVPDDVLAEARRYDAWQRRERGIKPRKKSDAPEDLREAAKERARLLRAGEPVPEDVLAKARECDAWQRRKRGIRPKRPKHGGIRREWRDAANAYRRLLRAGEPVPEEVMAGYRAYQMALKLARDPGAAARRRNKYGIPEELLEGERERDRRRKAGLPAPADALAKARKCGELRRRARGVKPARRKYDIPEDLREAVRERRRRQKAGLPVPEEVMEGCRAYRRACRRLRNPETGGRGRRPEREDVPEDLRAANREYQRRRRNNLPISDELRAMVAAYQRSLYRG